MNSKKVYQILIVEDESVLQQSLVNKIQRDGWQASSALNGEEGLRSLKRKKPDLILLDIRMPKMGGLEMLKEVRKKYDKKELPVIILTNYDEKENVSRSLELGAEIFLVKANYSLDDIMEKIKEVLG